MMRRIMIELYKWGNPKEWIETQYGKIQYIQLLEKEADRIMKNPGRRAEVRTKNRQCALFVDKVV